MERSYRVIIPEEEYLGVRFIQDGQKGVAEINTALVSFEPKIVFRWHLSIMLFLTELDDENLGTDSEIEVVNCFRNQVGADALDAGAKKPNGLFLGIINHDGLAELIWRVYDPASVDVYLRSLIREKSYLRAFDYRIDNDPQWELAEWHLSIAKG